MHPMDMKELNIYIFLEIEISGSKIRMTSK